jgi:hypothetical protein
MRGARSQDGAREAPAAGSSRPAGPSRPPGLLWPFGLLRPGWPPTASAGCVAGWTLLGLAGSLLLSATGAQVLDGQPLRWWITPHLGSLGDAHDLFWAGVCALCLAWLGLGATLRRPGAAGTLTPARLAAIGALWTVPLAAGAALFSRDMYSYLADGELLHLGLNPYTHAPAALAAVHQRALLDTVSPFWRHTTAPYGPLFIGLAAVIAAICGPHLLAAIILLRALELAGVVLLAVFVPRLARRLGADPGWAVWLAVISPLVLLELIAAGHNDALMAGLLVWGVDLALDRRPLAAVAVCSAAAAVKLPALAAVAMIAICWAREPEAPATADGQGPSGARSPAASAARAGGALAGAAATCAAVLLASGAVTGVGLSWLSGSVLSTPGKVHLAITPATAIGFSVHGLLASIGLHPGASPRPLELDFGHLTLALTALLGLWLCWRVRYERLVASLALLLLASVIGGPATWPWYLCWGLSLAACLPGWQRSAWLWLVCVAGSLVVYPNGILRFGVTSSPYILGFYALVAALAVVRARFRRATAASLPAPDGRPGASGNAGGAPGSDGARAGSVRAAQKTVEVLR